MSGENPFPDYPDAQLAKDIGVGGNLGYLVESIRRLRLAVENLSRASTILAIVMIALVVVQIGIAIYQALGRR